MQHCSSSWLPAASDCYQAAPACCYTGPHNLLPSAIMTAQSLICSDRINTPLKHRSQLWFHRDVNSNATGPLEMPAFCVSSSYHDWSSSGMTYGPLTEVWDLVWDLFTLSFTTKQLEWYHAFTCRFMFKCHLNVRIRKCNLSKENTLNSFRSLNVINICCLPMSDGMKSYNTSLLRIRH